MAATTWTATATRQTGVPVQGQSRPAVPRSSNRGMALPAVNPMVVGTSTAAAPAVPRAEVPAAIWITVMATERSKENSSASPTIIKQLGSANQHPGEHRTPISAPPKTRSMPWSSRPWPSVEGAPTCSPQSAGVPTSTPTWRRDHQKSTQPQSQSVRLGARHPTNRDGGVEGLGRRDDGVGEECSSGDVDPEVRGGESARASAPPGEDIQNEVRYGRSEEKGGSCGGLPDAEKDSHRRQSDQPRQWNADTGQWQPSLETVII